MSTTTISPSTRSNGQRAGVWRRLVASTFSFPVMCMALLTVVVFRYCIRGIPESDIWWHMRNARYLLQNHHLPSVDTYSFSAFGSPWMNFEWLSEIPFFVAFSHIGLRGLLLVYFLVLTLIFAGVYYRCCRAGADCKDGAIATLGAICLGGVSMAPRTLLFGWLCMVVLLLVLDRFRDTSKGLWVLPLLFVAWINLHGSWVFGIVVLAITLGAGMTEGEWGVVIARRWSREELRQLQWSFAACLVALFVNPFGYKLVIYPYTLLLRHQGVMEYIDEWQPANFSTVNGILVFLLFVAVLASALFLRPRWRLDDVLLMSFALWAAVSHVRFLFFAGLIVMPVLAPQLKLFPPYERAADKPWLNAFIIVAMTGLIVFIFPSNGRLQDRVNAEYPDAALAFIKHQNISGRIFNQYKWGGYMEWNAPDLKPFIDGRADIFIYNGVFPDFLRATALEDSYSILDKYKIKYVLLEPNAPLVYMLSHSHNWNPIYKDNVAVLLERSAPTPKALRQRSGS